MAEAVINGWAGFYHLQSPDALPEGKSPPTCLGVDSAALASP